MVPQGNLTGVRLTIYKHLGGVAPCLTPATKTDDGMDFIRKFNVLWTLVGNLIRSKYPKLAEQYQRIPEEHRKLDLFSLLIVNLTMGTKFHTDNKDYRNGFCVVFPFGEYEGGELHFPEYNLTICLRPGDVILFQSHQLQHGNLELKSGKRRSCVLVCHNDLMNRSME